MPASHPTGKPKVNGRVRAFVWDLLTFDKLMIGPVIHLIYWAGLALIMLVGFSMIGAAVGLGIRGGSMVGMALAFVTLIAGLIVLVALVLLWRGLSEFYLVVFSIAEDLRALRLAAEDEHGLPPSGVPDQSLGRNIEY
jgi:hypothetical protein